VGRHNTNTSHWIPKPLPLFGTVVIWSATGGNALSDLAFEVISNNREVYFVVFNRVNHKGIPI